MILKILWGFNSAVDLNESNKFKNEFKSTQFSNP